MVLDPDPNKQAQEVNFSRKLHFSKYPDFYYKSCSNLAVEKLKTQKHLVNI